jgi:hypothetical protein
MIFGVTIGTYFALKNLKKNQATLNTGLIVALLGSLLSAISMIVYDWTVFVLIFRVTPLGVFLNEIISYFIEVLIIGIVIGLIEGWYFKRKRPRIIINDDIDEEFYESLKTK